MGGRDISYRGKRLFDIVLFCVFALPAVVLGAACAVAIRLTSKGPILYRQRRVGRAEIEFEMLKFRTMTDDPNAPVPRPVEGNVTVVGRGLRRCSLDELPQLWNVARGEMSIVGPRPTLRDQVDTYDDRQRQRLAVRPGITGLAQVSGRQSIKWRERIDLDLDYVERQSLWLDLRLLVATVAAVVKGTGTDAPLDDQLEVADARESSP